MLPNGTTLPLGATYTISSKDGTQVGPFSISATLPTSFAVTNWDAITSINRANSLTINWTGSGFNTVAIEVLGLQTDSAISAINEVTVFCTVPSSGGALTIPADALAELPTGTGLLKVSATTSSGSGTSTPVSSMSQTLLPSVVGGGQVNYGSFTPAMVLGSSQRSCSSQQKAAVRKKKAGPVDKARSGNPARHPKTSIRAGSKKDKVLALLKRRQGATLKELMKATGWQAHSVRGFLSGTIAKKMGLTVRSEKRDDGERVYSIPKLHSVR